MADIPLSRSDYFRGVAKEARILTKNRYFEQNPVLNDQQTALIARMGLRKYKYVGDGPIRALYSQPGSFDNALFVASFNELWRVDTDGTATLVGTIPGTNIKAMVSMAATSNIGTTPAFLFVAGGAGLMCYIENGYARGEITGTPANNDVVRVDTVYYKFTSGSVDAGTPNGSSGNPWLVALGSTAADAWANLSAAFDATGIAGTDYSSALTANTLIQVESTSTTTVAIRANLVGALGNAIITTETGANIAWTAGTLTGGGDPSWFQVETPDDVGMVSVGYISSYVVCVPAQGQGINGRFYWIDPGETVINPLNFATAERAPDPISGVVVFGDQFWLPGDNTTEAWYFTGDIDAPVRRMQGVVFDRGAWAGTAVQIKGNMIIVGNDGTVFQIGGSTDPISRPDIAERIRKAIQYQAAYS